MAKYGYVASNVDFPEQNSQHFAPTTQIIMPPTQHYNYNYSLHHQQSDSSVTFFKFHLFYVIRNSLIN